MNSRKLVSLALALILVLAGCISAVAESGTVRLGALVHMTGPTSLTGTYYRNGIQMAVDDINEAGGILGKQIEVVYADEGPDTQTSVNALQKLLSEDVVAIIGTHVSTSAMAHTPLFLEQETMYFTNGSNPNMAAAGAPWMWQQRMKDSFTAPITAEIFFNELGVKNPAIIYNTAETTTVSMQAFREQYKAMGVDIPDSHIFAATEEETNFGNIINQVMATDTDGLYCMIVHASQAVIVSQQLKSAGYELPTIGNSMFIQPEFRTDPSSPGWYSVAEWTPSLINYPALEGIPEKAYDFATRFLAKYDMEASMHSACAYDSVFLFKEACERAGTTEDREAINEAMQQTDYQGVSNKFEFYGEQTLSTYTLLIQNNEQQDAVPVKIIQVIE